MREAHLFTTQMLSLSAVTLCCCSTQPRPPAAVCQLCNCTVGV